MRLSPKSWLIVVLAVSLLFIGQAEPSGRFQRAIDAAPASALFRSISLESAEVVGLVALDGRFVQDGSLRSVAAYAPYPVAGVLTTAVLDVEGSIASVASTWQGEAPDGSLVELDVRGSIDGLRWTVWHPAQEAVFARPVRFIQHRATLLGDTQSPSIMAIESLMYAGETRYRLCGPGRPQPFACSLHVKA